ncbi:MAG TPA: DUF5681 domain-containing protein [Rhizomicrobium sp.]|jgi:hypothetical protein|nr:DUF5681 domain-containing protein [Rhizomicrobium sp.]
MTESTATYAVGRGRPPLHTRFQKGQSGNPSGKPGPAKLAKQRFQRALYAALDGSEAELEHATPGTVLAGVARRLALAAVSGRVPAMRLLLSLLDAESGKDADDEVAEQLFTGAELFSLLQGKMQGNGKDWLEEILQPDAGGKTVQPRGDRSEQPVSEPAPVARERNDAASLVQGKTQGSANDPKQIFAAFEAKGMPVATRSQLMTGTAPAPASVRFGKSPPMGRRPPAAQASRDFRKPISSASARVAPGSAG